MTSTCSATIFPRYSSSCLTTEASGLEDFIRFSSRASRRAARSSSPEMQAVFHHDATIHHHQQAGLAGLLGRSIINEPILGPDRFGLKLDRLRDDLGDVFFAAEDIDDFDGSRR